MSRLRLRRIGPALALAAFWAGCGNGHGGDHDRPAATATALPSATVTTAPTPAPAVAWATGSALLRSDDGGVTWTDTETGRFSGVSFADRNVGWAVSEAAAGVVAHTTDGGSHWISQFPDVPGGIPILFAVAARNETDAVAVGTDVPVGDSAGRTPAIVHTTDGGTTWQRATLPAFGPGDSEGVGLLSVCLSPAGTGLAAGFDVADGVGALVLATADGGATWSDATSRIRPPGFGKVACGPDGRLWFLGHGPVVRLSEDGGATWLSRDADLPAHLSLWGGAFLGNGVGWLAAVTGGAEPHLVAYRTTDGGRTWLPRAAGGNLPVAIQWADIDALDDRHAVIVGQDGGFGALPSVGRSWTTSDGGDNWTTTAQPAPIDALWEVDLVP